MSWHKSEAQEDADNLCDRLNRQQKAADDNKGDTTGMGCHAAAQRLAGCQKGQEQLPQERRHCRDHADTIKLRKREGYRSLSHRRTD